MKPAKTFALIFSMIVRLSMVTLLTAILFDITCAQTVTKSNTDGTTPPGMAPGAPAGAFPLSGFENVNLYNRNLNFSLPLLKVGGRGTAQMTIPLRIERKWRVLHTIQPNIVCNRDGCTTYPPTHYYWAQPNWWGGPDPGYGPGVLEGRYSGAGKNSVVGQICVSITKWAQSVTRLTFTANDGTEYELRDQTFNGQPRQTANNCQDGNINRGNVFVTADGSSATFISDSAIFDNELTSSSAVTFYPSGYLILKDGARYRIVNGQVQWIRDRNGNRLSFGYDGSSRISSITDSLNRQVTFSYGDHTASQSDFITYHGSGGAARTIEIGYTSLSNALRSDQTIKSYSDLFPTLNGGATTSDPPVVSYVKLPDQRQYAFYYNSYWELARIVLPTGGAIEYDFSGEIVNGTSDDGNYYPEHEIIRYVTERRVYPNGGSGANFTAKTTYDGNIYGGAPTTVNVYVYNSSQQLALQSHEEHDFWGTATGDLFRNGAYYSDGRNGRENAARVYDSDGTTLLRKTVTVWGFRVDVSWPGAPSGQPGNDPRINDTFTSLLDNGNNLVSQVHTDYDDSIPYNNPKDVYEYGFGAGAPGPLIRRTHTDYVTLNNGVDYAGDTNIHIRNLPLQEQVFDAGGTKRAETIYEYDNYNPDVFHAALSDCPNISGHDGAFSVGYLTRGNLTRTSRSLLDNNGAATGSISSYAQYDIAGNVIKAIDANGNATNFDFSDRLGSPGDDAEQNTPPAELSGQTTYAFATKVTNALGHTAYTKYDYYLGKPVNIEDANGIVSSVAYNDALDRPTQTIQARYKVTTPPCVPPSVCVPAERRQTTITYDDTNHAITTTGDRDALNDNILTSKSYYDGLGRTWRGAAYEGSTNWTIKDTQFDALGRVSQVSNPYRAADPGSASPPSGLWTTTNYDALGRVIKVTTPDGAHIDTAYNGNQVTVIDQAGKKRSSETDALGRLVKVTEDPGTGRLNYDTTYFYDPLDNLRSVNQGGQGRWFAYDSLSRLIRVRNPEQNCNGNLPPHTDPYTGAYCWATAYSYDGNGNLTQRTDARGVVSNYFYDALNRNWGIDYINGSQKSNVFRAFDGAVNGKGRLYWERTQEGGTQETGTNVTVYAIDSYDALGRPLQKRPQFWQGSGWSPNYTVQQTYDLAGNVKTLTYPSGHTITSSYDQASRLSSLSGNLGGSPATYADTIGYNPAGQMIKERFGANTTLYHNMHYNSRLQLVDNRLGDSVTDEWNWNRGAITFYYGTTAVASGDILANNTDNNGNLRRQINWVPLAGGGYVNPQIDDYTYDALNRVSSFTEAQYSGGQTTFNVASQNFSYDRWGNRQITSATGGVNNYNPTYDTTNNPNRIVGLGYDAAGNITNDPLTGGTMTYDAENRLLTATNGAGGSYTYDADGKRVKRITGGLETWHIYGIGGELLAEYAAGAAPSAPQKEYGYRGGQLLVIAEPGSGGNLAWGKATSQSSTSFGGESSRGVDGNTSGNWGDNSVSHTNIEHQPWWQVDLGSVQQIGTVRLWNRTDCCSDRLSNFYVLVSDNPFSSTDLTTTINQAGVSSYYTAGPAGLLTEIGVGRSARYVRVQLAGDNYLSLAELEVMGGTTSGEGVKWLVQDHLGSTRMVVDRSGSLGGIRRHDFLPFGEEMSAGVGIRSAALGYGADSTRQKFTGKERDAETGLDFFEARYLSSTQGRFTSPDEFAGGPDELFIFADAASANPTFYADLTNPQSLNKYQYTYNNPLSYTDSDGHCPECPVYYVMSKIQQVDRKITQIKTDLVDYGKGLGKSVANAAIDTVNIGNVSIDDAGRLNYNYDRYEPSNQVQAMAMNSGNKLTLLSTLLGGRVPVNVAMAEGEGAAVVAGEAAAYDATAGNIGRMKAGKPPIGKDGSAIELHHTNQDPNGALIEMTPTEHRGPGNYAKNHPNGNTQPSKIDRAKFAKERKEYWKKKAQDLENKTQ